jgi:uncharacterized protein (DUF2267 family)
MRHIARQWTRAADRRRRYAAGRLQGWRYRRARREPAADVPRQVLVDRIRSVLGPLEKRLDLPRAHVTVEGRTAILHGDVGTERDASELADAVAHVAGVRAVRSQLHVGLTAGDTRPSEGRRHSPSPAHLQLVGAARGVGAPRPQEAAAAVLRVFSGRLPAAERAQLLSHLPADVRELATEPSRRWRRPRAARTLAEFDARVADATGLSLAEAETIARQVLTTVHMLVPEEEADVAAVLPAELRQLWQETALRSA